MLKSIFIIASLLTPIASFVPHQPPPPPPPLSQVQVQTFKTSTTKLSMISPGRSSSISSYNNDRSKRQERVGHVVRTEVASIIQLGYPIKNQMNEIDDDLRRRINVVNADVSPDLRQARITVSVMKSNKNLSEDDFFEEEEEEYLDDEEDDEEYEAEEEYDDDDDEEEEISLKQVFPQSQFGNGNAVVDRRRSYAWLVRNTKQIRHALSQRLKHMKSVPNLTFVLADVGAAVDVMNLIDKVSKGQYKRDDIGMFGGDNDNLPAGMYLESEYDDEDDYEWIDDDEDDEDEDWVDLEEGDEDDEDDDKVKASKSNQK